MPGHFVIESKESTIANGFLENLRYTLQSLQEKYPEHIEKIILNEITDEEDSEISIASKEEISSKKALGLLSKILLENIGQTLHSLKSYKEVNKILNSFDVINSALDKLQILEEQEKYRNTDDLEAEIQHLIYKYDLSYDSLDDLNHDYYFHYPEEDTRGLFEPPITSLEPVGKGKYIVIYVSHSDNINSENIIDEFIFNKKIKFFDTLEEAEKNYTYSDPDGTYHIIKRTEDNRFFSREERDKESNTYHTWQEIKITEEDVIHVLENLSSTDDNVFEKTYMMLQAEGIPKEAISEIDLHTAYAVYCKKHLKDTD